MDNDDQRPQWIDENTAVVHRTAEDLGPEILGQEMFDLATKPGQFPAGSAIRLTAVPKRDE